MNKSSTLKAQINLKLITKYNHWNTSSGSRYGSERLIGWLLDADDTKSGIDWCGSSSALSGLSLSSTAGIPIRLLLTTSVPLGREVVWA